MVGEEFAPIGKKLGIVVQTRAMSLKTGAQINMHAVGILSPEWWALLRRLLSESRPKAEDKSRDQN